MEGKGMILYATGISVCNEGETGKRSRIGQLPSLQNQYSFAPIPMPIVPPRPCRSMSKECGQGNDSLRNRDQRGQPRRNRQEVKNPSAALFAKSEFLCPHSHATVPPHSRAAG